MDSARRLLFGFVSTFLFLDNVATIGIANGPSMLPTINVAGDYAIIEKITFKYGLSIGDIVVLTSPVNPSRLLVKRILGLPGDAIYRQGIESGRYIVPKGKIWIEGDNQSDSLDSNAFGPVSIGLVRGRVPFIFRPWQLANQDFIPKVEIIK